jgi:hypothetical protein
MELKKKVAGVGVGVLAAAGIVYFKGGGNGLKEFETFRSVEGRFTVSMPGKPVKVTQTVESEIGDLDFTMFAADSTKFGFVVGYSDYPEDLLFDAEIAEVLGRLTIALAKKVEGKLINKTVLDDCGDAATQFQVNIPDQGILTTRLILDDNRLYQLIAMFPTNRQDEKKLAEFFDSFVITQK